MRRSFTAAALALAALGLAGVRLADGDARARSAAALDAEIPAPRRDDGFVSSDACRGCHPDTHATWHRSFHRTMTQRAAPGAVVAPFDGVTLSARGYTYKLSQDGDSFLVEGPDWEVERRKARAGVRTTRPGFADTLPRRAYRVVMTTGSHHMQTYWLEGSRGNEVFNLPFVYLIDDARWIPREDAFLRPPDAGPFRQTWNDNCILCHSTFGQPRRSREGVDTRAVELGIGCEACHGPGGEHVARHRSPLARLRAHTDDAPDETIANPARMEPRRAAEVCGQCHAKTFINDARAHNEGGSDYRPGEPLAGHRTVVLPRSDPDHPWLAASLRRDPSFVAQFFWPDGMIRVSGRELNGLVESRCHTHGDMTCTSCHSMHDADPDMQLASADPDAPCRECHPQIAAELTDHTHHAPKSQGSSCVNCHMPYTTYGLLRALRSHLVDSPTVAASSEHGRPNACNLCHLDRSLAWAGEQLAAWYGQEEVKLSDPWENTSAAALWLLRGDAAQRALVAWACGQAAARAASGQGWIAPLLAWLLDDPYAAVRLIAHRSLVSLPGQADLDYDFLADPAARQAARDEALRRHAAIASAYQSPGARVLAGEDGSPLWPEIRAHLAERDDRPVDLKE